MGVNGGFAQIRSSQAQLQKQRNNAIYRKSVFPDIQTSHSTVGDAIRAIKAKNPGKPLAVAVDVLGHLGHLLRSLPGKVALSTLRHLSDADPFGEGLDDFNTSYTAKFLAEVDALRQSLEVVLDGKNDKLIFFFDNSSVVSPLKLETYQQRRRTRQRAQVIFDSCYDQIQSIKQNLQLATWEKRKRIRRYYKPITKFAWSKASLQLPDDLFDGSTWQALASATSHMERNLQLNASTATRAQVAEAYLLHNAGLLTAQGTKIRLVKSLDEADMSIYRWSSAMASNGAHTVVLSADSDFSFIPSAADIQSTVSFRRCYPNSRKLSSEPWVWTSNVQLHAFLPTWPWTSTTQRLAVTMLVGHDYVPGGAEALGFRRLSSSGVCARATWEQTVEAMEEYRDQEPRPIWTRACQSVQDKMASFQRAIQACTIYLHPHPISSSDLPPPPVKNLPALQAEAGAYSRRDRFTARFPADNPSPTEIVRSLREVVHQASRAASRNPARAPNENLHNQRHHHRAHSNLISTRAEKDRRTVKPAKKEALLDILIDRHIDPVLNPAQADRADLMRRAGKTVAQPFVPLPPPSAAVPAAPFVTPAARRRQRKAEEEEEEEEGGSAKGSPAKRVPGVLYPMKTAKRLLSSALRSFTRSTQGRLNPIFSYFRLAVLATHCFNNILNGGMKMYIQELTRDVRMLPVALVRFRGGKVAWKEVVRQLANFLSASVSNHAIDAYTTTQTFLDEWSETFGGADQARCRLQLQLYCQSHNIFRHDIVHILAKRKVRPDQVDPVLLQIVARLLDKHGCSPLADLGLNWDLWTPQMQNIGVGILQKQASSSLRESLRKAIVGACREASDGARWSEDSAKEIFDTLLAFHGDFDADVDTWAMSILQEIPSIPDSERTTASAIHRWLVGFARAWNSFMPSSLENTSLLERLTTLDPNIRISDLCPFFSQLGHDFTVDIAPRFISFDFKLVYTLLKQVDSLPTVLLRHIEQHWLKPSRRTVDVHSLLHNGSSGIGALEEMCGQSLRRTTAQGYDVMPTWQGALRNQCTDLLSRLPKIASHRLDLRLPIINLLFDSCHLPKGHIWSGSFESDGESVCLGVIDIRKPVITPALTRFLTERDPQRAVSTYTVQEMFALICEYAPSFATLDTLKLRLGFAKRYRRKAAAAGHAKSSDIERVFIWNTWQQITGEVPATTGKVPKAAKPMSEVQIQKRGRRRMAKQEVQLADRRVERKQARSTFNATRVHLGQQSTSPLQKIQGEETENGLPVEFTRLSATTRNECIAALRALHETAHSGVDAGCSVAALLESTIKVGVDPGEIFPIAMAVQDRVQDRSARLMVAPHALEIHRRATQASRAHLHNSAPIDFPRLFECLRSARTSPEFASHLSPLTLVDFINRELIHSTKRYGRASFVSYRNRCRFEDLLSLQVKKWIWKQEFEENPNLRSSDIARPAIIYVGDGCSFERTGKGMKTADFSTALLRAIHRRFKSEGLPVLWWRIDEAYTSQCCYDPACLRPAERNWSTQEGGLDSVTEQTMEGKAEWIRSRVFMGTRSGTTDVNFRLLQCEKCKKLLNRDVSASFCIEQAGAHVLEHGRHPWRL